MKLIKLKKTAAVLGVLAWTAVSVAGCGDKDTTTTVNGLDPNAVVLSVGDEEVKMSQAYFLMKWQQANYQNIISSYGYGDDWYKTDIFGTGESYQDYFKKYYQDILTRICFARSVMDEYGVEITSEEQKQIDEAVSDYMSANVKSARAAMMADEDVVRQVLTDYKILEKVSAAMTEDVNKNISDEEYKEAAYTRTYDYVYVPFTTTDENGETVMMSAAQQEELYNQLSAIRTETLSTGDFENAVANAGQQVSSHTYKPSADKSDDSLYDVNQVMEDYKIGEVTEVIPLDTTGAMIAYVTGDNSDDLDSEETRSSAEEEIMLSRKQDLFESKLKELHEKTNVEINEELWNRITMEEPLAILSSK